MNKKDISNLLEKMQTVMLATTDGEKAFVRPVVLIFHKDRFFIATGSEDDKCSQIRQKPDLEICWYINSPEKGHYLRLNGNANFIENFTLRKEIMDIADFIKNYWTDPADEGFALLEIIPHYAAFMKYGTSREDRVEY